MLVLVLGGVGVQLAILLTVLVSGPPRVEEVVLLPVSLVILLGSGVLLWRTMRLGRDVAVERDERFSEVSRRLELALEVSQIGFWDVDLETDTLRWDARTCRHMGVTDRNGYFTEADWLSALHPDDRNRATTAAEAAIATRGQFCSDYRVIWPNGEIRHLRDMAAYYLTAKGQPRIAGLVWDVTEDRRREAELELRREEAESAHKAKSSFLAAMSHEIRTPLGGVIGMLELMQSDELPGEQAERARIASASAADLLRLLNDVLDLSKLEAASVTLSPAPVDIRRLVADVVDLMSARGAQKGIRVSHVVEETVPSWVSCDSVRFRQVLTNIVSNAVTYTDAGSVVVRAASVDGVRLRVAVEDSGIGIAPADQERVFERFVQAEASSRRQSGGTGLGLAIARELAELMGGGIGVESTPGQGSTFTFEVRAEACEPPRQDCAPAEVRSDRGLEVLVAEDNATNRFLISSLLRRSGHRVTMVPNGHEAVEAVRSGAFDVVLMDVQMPEMDGLAASKAIRSLDAPASITPIVALTASVLADNRERYLAAGMDDCLAKPIDVAALREVLARTVPRVEEEPEVRRVAASA